MKKITSWKSISVIPLIVTLLFFNACTTIQFKSIAPPQPASKLRVAILSITGDKAKYGWSIPHDRWSTLMFKMVNEHLQDMGIYEVVPQEDLHYAVGTQGLNVDEYWWLKNDCALLKQYGKALYADYAMIITRDGSLSPSYKYDIKLINIETGMRYLVSESHLFAGADDSTAKIITEKIFPRMYRKLFSEAKKDLLATAVRKGRLIPTEEIKKSAAPETILALVPPAAAKPAPAPSSAPKRNEFEKIMERGLQNKKPVTDKTRLVVYDFNANEQLQVVSLILSEALREELFLLGNFSLVNRENVVQVMQELSLQQSGLVDEKQVLKVGKWLAANEAVTGRFTQFGNSFILQAKRTDITTMNTLGFGSLKCKAGQEDKLLAGLPELARKIAGLEK